MAALEAVVAVYLQVAAIETNYEVAPPSHETPTARLVLSLVFVRLGHCAGVSLW